MRRSIILLFSIVSLSAFAQNPQTIDSLKSLLSEAGDDMHKYELLNHLYKETIDIDIEAAADYANQMVALGQVLKSDSILTLGYERKGVTFAYRNIFDSSRVYFDKTLELALAAEDYKSAGSVLRNIGQDINIMGDLDSALYFYNLAGAYFAMADDPDGISGIYNSQAVVYWQKGYYNLSLEAAFKADSIMQILPESAELYQNYMVIAAAYSEMKDTLNAIDYYLRLNDFFRDYGLMRQLCSNLLLVSTLQIPIEERREQTEAQFNEAMQIAADLQNERVVAEAQIGYAEYLLYYGSSQEALDILLPIADKYAQAETPLMTAETYNVIGRANMELGQHGKAIPYLKKAEQSASELGLTKEVIRSLEYQSEAYQALNNPANALKTYKRFTALNDSLYNVESKNRFSELQTIYETERKEAELALQDQEIEALNIQAENDQLTKTIYGVGWASFVVIAGLLFFGFKQRIKKNRIEREKQEELFKKELAFKKKELASQTLHLVQKSSFIQELKENLERIKSSPELFKVEFRRLVMLLKKESAEDKDWEVFKAYFSEVHNDFDQSLKAVYPDITEKEIRLSAYLRMNLTTKEIASLLNVLPDSVIKSKYRLKKKLNLGKDDDLNVFLSGLG